MNQNNFHNVFFIKIEILTPVHIGNGVERHLKRNYDYLIDGKKLKIYTLNSLLQQNQLVEAIISDEFNLENLYRKFKPIFPKEFISYDIDYDGTEIRQIFAHIKDGNGKFYIPGSSLKGAIRSVLLGNMVGAAKMKNNNNVEVQVFGSINEDVLRHLQLTDAYFEKNDMKLCSCKIFTLKQDFQKQNFQGAWKDQLKGSSYQFSPNKFVSFYECIKPKSYSVFRMVITKRLKNVKNDEKIQKFFLDNEAPLKSFQNLCKNINEHTKSYLEKEIKFFQTHQGQYHIQIIDSLQKILQKINSNKKDSDSNSCILHLGYGSGFHGITGDWQLKEHIINNIRGKNNRGYYDNSLSAKTRKLLFEKEGTNSYVFYPFGFIKLSLIEENEYNEILKGKISELYPFANENSTHRHYQSAINITQTTETSVFEKDYISFHKIKSDKTLVLAQVVESGNPNYVQLFITDYSGDINHVLLKNYNSEIQVGRFLYVTLNIQKGTIQYARFEKFS